MKTVRFGAIQPEMRHGEPSLEYVKAQVANTAALLGRVGEQGCDAVTTCEDLAMLSHLTTDDDTLFSEYVDISVPYVEEALSNAARKYSMYVIGCYMKRLNGKIYNTGAVFNRGGVIIGENRKVQLPANEAWQVAAGDAFEVFDLDFGRVGVLICYDMMFPETARVLTLRGAEVIFHPTFGYGWNDGIGEATLRTRANDNGVYIVTSKNYVYNGAGKSSVIDPWGHVLADAGFERNAVVVREVDFDNKKTQPDYYINSHITGEWNVRERMLKERRAELFGIIGEPNEKLREFSNDEKNAIREGLKSGEIHW